MKKRAHSHLNFNKKLRDSLAMRDKGNVCDYVTLVI